MEPVEVPAEETVPLDAVAPGVVGLRVLLVNVFAVRTGNRWVLVDAGLHGSAGRIMRWARSHFGDEPPAAILLTHAHFDHVGALDTLVDEWKAPVYAHPQEIPYVTGGQSYPAPDPTVGGGLMARMSVLYPREPRQFHGHIDALPRDGAVPALAGWRWIHTPGHTAGHVSFFQDVDRTLIVGDAFCTTRQESFLAVATQRPELHGPPAYFTTDWNAARDSVRHLSSLQPAFLAPGHGQPMAGDATTRALAELGARFDAVARPAHGRYVEHPTPQ